MYYSLFSLKEVLIKLLDKLEDAVATVLCAELSLLCSPHLYESSQVE